MGHFQNTVRRNTGFQIRKLINNKIGDQDEKNEDKGKAGKVDKWQSMRKEYNQNILQAYEDLLKKNTFLTGQKITVVDIIVYSEIETIIKLTKEPIPSHFGSLSAWYDKLSENKTIKEANQ